MNPSEVAGVLGAFGLVVLLFSWLRVRVSATPAVAPKLTDGLADAAESSADEAAQIRFRDEMMARLRERWDGALELEASDAISFTVKTPSQDQDEAMLVVLVNVYSGCVKYPDGEERFKEHFLDELISTMQKHLS